MYGLLDVFYCFGIRRFSASIRILYLLNCSYPKECFPETNQPSRNKKLEDRK